MKKGTHLCHEMVAKSLHFRLLGLLFYFLSFLLNLSSHLLTWFQGLMGRNTRVLDLKGKLVLPGFIDSHVHLISGGLQVGQLEILLAIQIKFFFHRGL